MQKLTQLAVSGKCEAYNLPLGVISHLYREIAGGRPRLFSKVGLGTFIDPRNGGGKMNSNTTQDLVEMVDFRGEEWLLQCVPIDVVILRGKTADPSATSRWRRRPRRSTTCSSPWPARPAGIVIVQVERIVPAGSLHSRDIKIRGHLVDYVVVAQPKDHMQTYATDYNGAFSGEFRAPPDSARSMENLTHLHADQIGEENSVSSGVDMSPMHGFIRCSRPGGDSEGGRCCSASLERIRRNGRRSSAKWDRVVVDELRESF